MTDIFISYSRKDIAFARLLYQSLGQCQLDTWIDWERIPVGENWWSEICQAIEKAHVFMFIISRNSIGSNVCREEIAEALRHHKRIIPIVVDNLGPEVVGSFVPDLNKINWILFERDHIFQIVEVQDSQIQNLEDGQDALPKDPQFKEALEKLVDAIHTDWDWVKYHTQLQVEALRWEANQRNASYLILGAALEEAERIILSAGGKDPQPTALQGEFITTSRQEETRRRQVELQLEQKARQRQRLALWAVGIGLVVALVLGVIAWGQRNEAVAQSHTRATAEAVAVAESHNRATAEANAVSEANVRATAQAVAEEQRNVAVSKQIAIQANSMLDTQLDLALLLSIKATSISSDIEAKSSLLQGVLHVPFLQKILMTGTQDSNFGVATSVDGSQIAAGHMEEIWVFEAQSGTLIQRYADTIDAQVGKLAYDPNGKFLAAGRSNGMVVLWDLEKGPGQGPQVFDGDQKAITALVYSPDGRTLASGSADGTVILWDVASGRSLFRFPDEIPSASMKILSVAFSPDGRLLAAGTFASFVYLVDTKTGEEITEPVNARALWGKSADSANYCASSVAFHPDGKRLAIAAGLGVAVIDLDSKQALNPEPVTHRTNCAFRGVAFTPNGQYMVSGGCGELLVEQADSYDVVYSLTTPLVQIDSLAISPDGQSFVTSGANGNVLLWSMDDRPWRTQERLTAHNSDDPLNFTVMDHSAGTDLFAANICSFVRCSEEDITRNTVVVWEGGKFQERAILEDPSAVIYDLVISPDGKYLAGVSDSTPWIYLWDIASRKIRYRLSLHNGFTPTSVSFTPDGTLLFAVGCTQPDPTACEVGAIQVWDPASGQPVGEMIQAHQNNINRVAFRPDGKRFATVGSDDLLLIWDSQQMHKFEEVSLPSTLTTGIHSVVFSPDGQRLALGTGKGKVYVWDLHAAPSLAATFTGRDGYSIYSLEFSPDGQYLAGSNMDGSVYLWDINRLKQYGPEMLNNYLSHTISPLYISSVVFGDTPNELWVSGHLGLSKWDIGEERLKMEACQLANRNFTAEEWQQYFPDEPYQLVCPDQNADIENAGPVS